MSIARKTGKQTCIISPVSRFLVKILDIIKVNGYINKYEIISDSRGGFIKLELSENLNNCKAIRPRLPIKAEEITKYEKRFLPSLGFGIIILSTNKGIMTNNDAKAAKIGGSLIAYVY
jgi:small subunit ribosomal protein S8